LALLLPRVSAVSLSVLGGCLAAALLAGGWAAYAYAGLLLDPFYPIVALFGVLTVLTFYVYRYAERQRHRLQLVFADDPAPVAGAAPVPLNRT
jgi:CHASE2 domain-containing sensor protein